MLEVTSNGEIQKHHCDYVSQSGQPPEGIFGIRVDDITAGDWTSQQMKSLLQ